MENEDQSNTNYESNANENKSTKSGSASGADDVKQRVKESVSKGVAAVAGALKGFSEEAQKHDLAGSTKQAIQKAGETTRQLAGTVTKEFQQTKEHLKKGGSGTSAMGSTGLGGSELGTGSTELGSKTTELGSTAPPTFGSSTLPDIRKTDIAKTDEELKE